MNTFLKAVAALFGVLALLASTAGVASATDDTVADEPIEDLATPDQREEETSKENRAEQANEAEEKAAEQAEEAKAKDAEAAAAEELEDAERSAETEAPAPAPAADEDANGAAQVNRSEGQGNNDPGPRGNNGTVKIDGIDLDDGPGNSNQPNDPDENVTDNDPHVTCGFQVEFFNFDRGQKADIVFTAHPPTGNGGVLLAQESIEISDDGTAGAANDLDVVIDYDIEQFDTTQFTSVHDRHGWHVKLSLTIYNEDGSEVPGGQKHKVFWVDECLPEVAPETPCPDGMVEDEDGECEIPETDCPDDEVMNEERECEAVEGDECPEDTVMVDDDCIEIDDDGNGGTEDDGPDVVDGDEEDVLDEVVVNMPPTTPVRPATPATPTVNPATPASPAVQTIVDRNPQVLGAQVTRTGQLPRTGDGTTNLVPFSLGLVLLGFGIQRTSKRLSTARVR
jgi:hypothetical protein